jgi:hypothetical protein
MKTSKERRQRMLEMIEHDLKLWKPFNKDERTKKYLAKLRYERRKWRNMETLED